MIQRGLLLFFMVAFLLVWPSQAQDNTANVTIHVVQRGETLYRIAQQYGLTVSDLAALNGLLDPSNIKVGQRLLVPIAGNPIPAQPLTHIVQAGETLRSIAQLYNQTIEELAARNNITDINTLYIGQVLALSNAQSPAPSPTQPQPTPIAQVAQAPAPASSANSILYVVQRGDTLFRIATRYGVTVNTLTQANSISDPTLIYAGQQIIIPAGEAPQIALDLPATISQLDVSPTLLVEGKSARIQFTSTVPMNVGGTFLDKTLNVASEESNTRHTIFVGIPVFTSAGIYPVTLVLTDANGAQTSLTLNLQIVAGGYGRESLTIGADQADLLNPNVEAAEQAVLQSVMGRFSPTRYFDGPMGLPAAASITSPFGRNRSYNGGPFDRFHSGTDFAGAPGTPVLAAASGVVVMVDRLNIRGNATIIDHGWGIYTGYWHQTEQYVSVGDIVSTGQVIGTIGSTGRVTGPHLHWELWVNGLPVDPMQWVQQPFP
jgi:murein DD-endopeptidase MepM/ murein hydrolase activator NlpD